MKIKERYRFNKAAKKGEEIICPSCGTSFVKNNPQQAFCKTKGGTMCKDKYWNTVDPRKRNNTTRISPANARYMERMKEMRMECEDIDHPFSCEGLGQWID
jgi:uncharacterized Zn-finger protein